LLSRLLIVLVVCLVAIGLPAAPVQANGAYITVSPSSGVPGEEVEVRGYNFTPDHYVDIYYDGSRLDLYVDGHYRDDVRIDGDRYFEASFFVPESCKGDHTVLADEYGTSIYDDQDFTVKPGLTVSPEQGPVGTNVTVKGLGFAANETNIELRYYINGNYTTIASNISANATGSWQKSFQIPASARGSHKIDAKGDSSNFAAVKDVFFTVTPVISLGKLWGSPGENITMTGRGFAASERDITILFSGQPVRPEIRADDTGYWEENFQVPQMLKGTHNVTAYGESTPQAAVSPLSFEIRAGLVLSSAEGHVDMDLTVIGGGFAPNKDVVLKYEGEQIATATTNSSGSFTVIFPVPESQHGERVVTAEDAAGNNATAIFTMESDPPDTPELISPPDGSRVGFIGKMRPTFNWSAVSDLSGVRYNLQIASSANVTTTGFANFMVSVPVIVGTNYTLNATQALPYGTYYWIVQAVDRAGNAGNWTMPMSFRAGRLPLWAFILIIVAAVAVIGTLVYFFVIRRRIYYY
jgi:hypothetical protein